MTLGSSLMTFSRVSFLAVLPIAGLLATSALALAAPDAEWTGVQKTSGDAPRLLCSPGQLSVKSDGLGLYDTGRGLTLMPVSAGQSCKLMATASGLSFVFPGQQPLLLATQVAYRLNTAPREVAASLAEPALCHSYYQANDQLVLKLTDTNAVVHTLRGLTRIGYAPDTRRFSPQFASVATGSQVQCYGFPFSALINNPPAVPAEPPVDTNLVFASGFDDSADLRIDILSADGSQRIRQLDAVEGQNFSFRIRVSNAGPLRATGVVVKEWAPLPAAQPILSPVVTPGSWTCNSITPGNAAVPCTGSPSGEGLINLNNLSLQPNEVLEFNVTRRVPTGAPPARTLMAAALFFDPLDGQGLGDKRTTDNSVPLVIRLVANQGPNIACAGLTSPVEFDENPPAREFTCSLTDPEGDAIATFTVPSNSNPSLVPSAGMLTPLGSDQWRLRLAPEQGMLGSADLILRATDDRGGSRDLAVRVNVNDINSPPSFALLRNELRLYPGPFDGPVRDGDNAMLVKGTDYTLGDDCRNGQMSTCTVSFSQYLTNVSVGVPPESPTQQVSPSIQCSGSGLLQGGVAVLSPAGPSAPSVPVALQFTHYKSQSGFFNPAAVVTCAIKLTDTGNPPLDSPTQTLTLRFQSPP
jgi:hypothetical protein